MLGADKIGLLDLWCLRRLRERDDKQKKKDDQERERGTSFGHVSRYAMVAKRIW